MRERDGVLINVFNSSRLRRSYRFTQHIPFTDESAPHLADTLEPRTLPRVYKLPAKRRVCKRMTHFRRR